MQPVQQLLLNSNKVTCAEPAHIAPRLVQKNAVELPQQGFLVEWLAHLPVNPSNSKHFPNLLKQPQAKVHVAPILAFWVCLGTRQRPFGWQETDQPTTAATTTPATTCWSPWTWTTHNGHKVDTSCMATKSLLMLLPTLPGNELHYPIYKTLQWLAPRMADGEIVHLKQASESFRPNNPLAAGCGKSTPRNLLWRYPSRSEPCVHCGPTPYQWSLCCAAGEPVCFC